MILEPEKQKVATAKPLTNAMIGTKRYSRLAVYRVDRETAMAMQASGKFKVIMDAGEDDDTKPAPASEAPQETKPDEGTSLDDINRMTVKDAIESIAAMTDRSLLDAIKEQASKKGTRRAAAERLAALK